LRAILLVGFGSLELKFYIDSVNDTSTYPLIGWTDVTYSGVDFEQNACSFIDFPSISVVGYTGDMLLAQNRSRIQALQANALSSLQLARTSGETAYMQVVNNVNAATYAAGQSANAGYLAATFGIQANSANRDTQSTALNARYALDIDMLNARGLFRGVHDVMSGISSSGNLLGAVVGGFNAGISSGFNYMMAERQLTRTRGINQSLLNSNFRTEQIQADHNRQLAYNTSTNIANNNRITAIENANLQRQLSLQAAEVNYQQTQASIQAEIDGYSRIPNSSLVAAGASIRAYATQPYCYAVLRIPKQHIRKKLENYFYKYGYAYNRMIGAHNTTTATPRAINLTTQTRLNKYLPMYWQFDELEFIISQNKHIMPVQYINMLKTIFQSGVTIWRYADTTNNINQIKMYDALFAGETVSTIG
jgi:hypothetical protein